jgi:hypothetical protein
MPKSKQEQFMLVVMPRKSDALIIGNGKSRLQFDLKQLQELFTTYGCNALYRDFIPDYLISMDFAMVDEILNSNVHHKTKFYTQYSQKAQHRHNIGEPVYWAIQDRWIGDSGTGALRLACMNNHDNIYMIGFDYTNNNKHTDNVYAGTKNYAPGPITNGGDFMLKQWETRLRHWCKEYNNINIFRVNANGYKPVCHESNFKNITVEQFKEKINELQNG